MQTDELTAQESWVSDTDTWGVKSRGICLAIDPTDFSLCPNVPLCIDAETDEQDNFVGLGIYDGGGTVFYFTRLDQLVKTTLENACLIGHNIKSDAQWLRKWGLKIRPEQLVYDTMLASYVQDSTKQSHALKDLVREIAGYEYPAYKEIVGTAKSKVTLDKQPVSLVANYCGMDVLSTHRLYTYFEKVLSQAEQHYLKEIELPTMRALMLMEERGVQVNAAYLSDLDTRFNLEARGLDERIKLYARHVTNINSNRQIADFLISKGFKLPKTPKGSPSVSAKALESYSHVPFVKALRRYSELEKLTGTYTKPLIERSNGQESYRLHANFNQAITHTGRLSSSKPNLQNIPTRTATGNLLRRAFTARPGCVLIDADYSQIEPRLFAHFSQDPELLKIFNNDLDLYDYVAASIGCTRPVAKTVWLALSYNAGAFRISETAHIPVSDSYRFIDKMQTKFNVAFNWKESVINQAECDKAVTTLFGRQIKIEDARLAPNYKVQGSAAEIMKKAITDLSYLNPVLNVHDELLFEIPYPQRDGELEGYFLGIDRGMQNVAKLSVPLKVEIGSGYTWGDAKS